MSQCDECGRPSPDAYLCVGCSSELEKALGDLPGLLGDLADVAARRDRRYLGTGKPRDPDPDWRGGQYALIRTPWILDVDAAAELERIGNELAGWVRHLCESRRVEMPEEHIIGCVGFLLKNLNAIRQDEAAAEILTEIKQLRHDLLRAVDNSPSPFYAGPCHAVVEEPVVRERNGRIVVTLSRHKCERHLYAWINPWNPNADLDRRIICNGLRTNEDGCGSAHTVESRREWLIDSMEDALVPLRIWQKALPKVHTSLTWPHASWWTRLSDETNMRRVVLPRSVVRGVELFRGGDLVDHVRREQVRIQANIEARKRAKGRAG